VELLKITFKRARYINSISQVLSGKEVQELNEGLIASLISRWESIEEKVDTKLAEITGSGIDESTCYLSTSLPTRWHHDPMMVRVSDNIEETIIALLHLIVHKKIHQNSYVLNRLKILSVASDINLNILIDTLSFYIVSLLMKDIVGKDFLNTILNIQKERGTRGYIASKLITRLQRKAIKDNIEDITETLIDLFLSTHNV